MLEKIKLMIKKFSVVCLFLLVISSCSVDFDPAGDLLDVPVIYANFNKDQSYHYLRISRTFYQRLDGAEIKNSLYHTDSLDIMLEVFKDGQRVGHPILPELTPLDKEDGIFDSENQLVYRFKNDFVGSSDCYLFINNKVTNSSITAKCQIMDLSEFNSNLTPLLTHLEFTTLEGVFFYHAYELFHYVEVSQTDTLYKQVRFEIGEAINGDLKSGLLLNMDLERIDLLSQLPRYIQKNTEVVRYPLERPIEFRLTIGDQYLYDWRKSFADNQSINSLLSVSNVQGGMGLFTSYADKRLFVQPIVPTFFDKLATDDRTASLNFSNYPWQ